MQGLLRHQFEGAKSLERGSGLFSAWHRHGSWRSLSRHGDGPGDPLHRTSAPESPSTLRLRVAIHPSPFVFSLLRTSYPAQVGAGVSSAPITLAGGFFGALVYGLMEPIIASKLVSGTPYFSHVLADDYTRMPYRVSVSCRRCRWCAAHACLPTSTFQRMVLGVEVFASSSNSAPFS